MPICVMSNIHVHVCVKEVSEILNFLSVGMCNFSIVWSLDQMIQKPYWTHNVTTHKWSVGIPSMGLCLIKTQTNPECRRQTQIGALSP